MDYDGGYDSGSSTSSSSDDSRKSKSRTKSGLSAAGSGLRQAGKDMADRAAAIGDSIRPVQYRKGGKVRKAKSRRMKGRKKSR